MTSQLSYPECYSFRIKKKTDKFQLFFFSKKTIKIITDCDKRKRKALIHSLNT